MNLNNMKVGTRLGFGFAIALLLSIAITAISISSIISIKRMLHADNDSPKLVTLMDAALADRMIALRNLALLVEDADKEAEVGIIKANDKNFAQAAEQIGKLFAMPARAAAAEENALLASVKGAEAALQPLVGQGDRTRTGAQPGRPDHPAGGTNASAAGENAQGSGDPAGAGAQVQRAGHAGGRGRLRERSHADPDPVRSGVAGGRRVGLPDYPRLAQAAGRRTRLCQHGAAATGSRRSRADDHNQGRRSGQPVVLGKGDAPEPGQHRVPGAQRHRHHRHRLRPDRRRQPGPVEPDRSAGQQP